MYVKTSMQKHVCQNMHALFMVDSFQAYGRWAASRRRLQHKHSNTNSAAIRNSTAPAVPNHPCGTFIDIFVVPGLPSIRVKAHFSDFWDGQTAFQQP